MGESLFNRGRFMMAHVSMLCAQISCAVIACDKREAFAQGSEAIEAIHSLFPRAGWIASAFAR
jgi:hypothetical protein